MPLPASICPLARLRSIQHLMTLTADLLGASRRAVVTADPKAPGTYLLTATVKVPGTWLPKVRSTNLLVRA